MEDKPNDWIATILYNPNKDIDDLAKAGITGQNTTMKDAKYYSEIPEVRETFKNSDGSFDNKKFNEFYNQALVSYNSLVNNDSLNTNLRQKEWSYFA